MSGDLQVRKRKAKYKKRDDMEQQTISSAIPRNGSNHSGSEPSGSSSSSIGSGQGITTTCDIARDSKHVASGCLAKTFCVFLILLLLVMTGLIYVQQHPEGLNNSGKHLHGHQQVMLQKIEEQIVSAEDIIKSSQQPLIQEVVVDIPDSVGDNKAPVEEPPFVKNTAFKLEGDDERPDNKVFLSSKMKYKENITMVKVDETSDTLEQTKGKSDSKLKAIVDIKQKINIDGIADKDKKADKHLSQVEKIAVAAIRISDKMGDDIQNELSKSNVDQINSTVLPNDLTQSSVKKFPQGTTPKESKNSDSVSKKSSQHKPRSNRFAKPQSAAPAELQQHSNALERASRLMEAVEELSPGHAIVEELQPHLAGAQRDLRAGSIEGMEETTKHLLLILEDVYVRLVDEQENTLELSDGSPLPVDNPTSGDVDATAHVLSNSESTESSISAKDTLAPLSVDISSAASFHSIHPTEGDTEAQHSHVLTMSPADLTENVDTTKSFSISVTQKSSADFSNVQTLPFESSKVSSSDTAIRAPMDISGTLLSDDFSKYSPNDAYEMSSSDVTASVNSDSAEKLETDIKKSISSDFTKTSANTVKTSVKLPKPVPAQAYSTSAQASPVPSQAPPVSSQVLLVSSKVPPVLSQVPLVPSQVLPVPSEATLVPSPATSAPAQASPVLVTESAAPARELPVPVPEYAAPAPAQMSTPSARAPSSLPEASTAFFSAAIVEESTPKELPASSSGPALSELMEEDLLGPEDTEELTSNLRHAEDRMEQDPLASLSIFTTAWRAQPLSARAALGRARCLDLLAKREKSNDRLDQAIKSYRTVLQLAEQHAPLVSERMVRATANTLIDCLRFRGQLSTCSAVQRSLLSQFPGDAMLRSQLGITLLLHGKTSEAEQEFREVLREHPDNGLAQVHLGFILKTVRSDHHTGAALLRAGLQTGAPGTRDARFYFHLGDALQRTGRGGEARKVYEEAAGLRLFLRPEQRSLYNVARLTARPVWSPEHTPYRDFLHTLEQNWRSIRTEGEVLLADAAAFTPEAEQLRESGEWGQLVLFNRGRRSAHNCERAPYTCAVVGAYAPAARCTRGQVKFSLMSGGTHVWSHCGPTNCRLRAHLGLVVPRTPPLPVLRVHEQELHWQEGRVLMFDDSFEHEVWHNGTEPRLVLIVDLWHPDLTERERKELPPV